MTIYGNVIDISFGSDLLHRCRTEPTSSKRLCGCLQDSESCVDYFCDGHAECKSEATCMITVRLLAESTDSTMLNSFMPMHCGERKTGARRPQCSLPLTPLA